MKIDVELLDTRDAKNHQQLVKGGGKQQVPCLKIDNSDGNKSKIQWMYESGDIINYFNSLVNKA